MELDAESVRVALPAVAPPPPYSHWSELPPRDKRQAHSEPARDHRSEDTERAALFGRHSKLYQRRKEVEAELKHEFSLPEEATAVLRELRARRSTPVGCPPPVPKPRVSKTKLPPLPKPAESSCQTRWGVIDEQTPKKDPHDREQAGVETPWWKLEQQTLARRNAERSSDMRAEHPALGEPTDNSSWDRAVQQRPQSWRMGRPMGPKPTAQPDAQGLEPQGGERVSKEDEPWRAKAKELEAIAAAHRLRHEEMRRKEAERRELQSGYPSSENEEARAAPAQANFRDLRQREEQRFEEMKQEEIRRLAQEREEARKRRQEQEEWEQAMRRRFAEEAEQLKAARRMQQEMEDQQQRQWKEGMQRQQAAKEEKRKAEQQSRSAAEAKARSSTPPFGRNGPAPPRQSGPVPSPRQEPSPPRAPRPSAPSPSPTGRLHRSGRFKANARSGQASELRASGTAELQAAKSAAMRQLLVLRQNPSREARHKGFKELLRMWHPDKNPGSSEVATAVFQMIQAERGRVFK